MCVPVNKTAHLRRYISPVQESREFSASPENVAAARRFVAAIALAWDLDDLEWPLVQVVSELASNAIIHAGTDFTVCLDREDEAIRLEVIDTSSRRVQTRSYDLDATTGRGLRLVERLAREWGVAKAENGKSVWAIVDGSATAERDPELALEAFLDLDDEPEPEGGSGDIAHAATFRNALFETALAA